MNATTLENLELRGEGAIAPARTKGMLELTARTLERHIRDRFAIDSALRDEMVAEARALMKSSQERVRIQALRVLALLDMVNVRREHNAIMVRGQDQEIGAAVLSAALGTPESRAALAALSGSLGVSVLRGGELEAGEDGNGKVGGAKGEAEPQAEVGQSAVKPALDRVAEGQLGGP